MQVRDPHIREVAMRQIRLYESTVVDIATGPLPEVAGRVSIEEATRVHGLRPARYVTIVLCLTRDAACRVVSRRGCMDRRERT